MTSPKAHSKAAAAISRRQFGLTLVAATTIVASPATQANIVAPAKGFENLRERLEVAAKSIQRQISQRQAAQHATVPLQLFVMKGCGYCTAAERYLSEHGIAYQTLDTETREGAEAFRNASATTDGAGGVPLLLQGTRYVRGFSRGRYDAFFRK